MPNDENRARVKRAMRTVPRHRFLPAESAPFARLNRALPIGYGQTISQPGLVARMTELLELQPGDRVLEVGTGSGYQTAILASLGGVDVYSVEIIPELAHAARERLEALGYTGVHLRLGDGYEGWPEHAPYHGIIVTAAAPHVPPPLVEQLADGGRLVIPVGPPGETQTLYRFIKHGTALRVTHELPVAFVPLTRPRPEG